MTPAQRCYRRAMDARGVLLDIDGVLTMSWRALPGAVDAVDALRAAGLPVLLLTNTTSRSRASMTTALREAGFPVVETDVLTAPAATAAYLAEHYPGARCLLLNHGDLGTDLDAVNWVTTNPDVVVVGGGGTEFDYSALNAAFRHLQSGARLVAMARNMFWQTSAGPQLDGGPFVLALEHASGVQAEVVGKPSRAFFATACAELGVAPQQALMVGDDIESDVLAAQDAGIVGVLVRTGKFRAETVARAEGEPNHIIDSIADLPALLGLPSHARNSQRG